MEKVDSSRAMIAYQEAIILISLAKNKYLLPTSKRYSVEQPPSRRLTKLQQKAVGISLRWGFLCSVLILRSNRATLSTRDFGYISQNKQSNSAKTNYSTNYAYFHSYVFLVYARIASKRYITPGSSSDAGKNDRYKT